MASAARLLCLVVAIGLVCVSTAQPTSISYTASTAVSGQTAQTIGINTAANVDPAWITWITRLNVNGERTPLITLTWLDSPRPSGHSSPSCRLFRFRLESDLLYAVHVHSDLLNTLVRRTAAK